MTEFKIILLIFSPWIVMLIICNVLMMLGIITAEDLME